MAFTDQRVFFREFLNQYRTTGSILPSSRALARALARYVHEGTHERPRKILEVGPGTGAVTVSIIKAMRPDDQLDLVEVNGQFVERLRERSRHEPLFQRLGERFRLVHGRVEELPNLGSYDVLVSGLPLNNFAVVEVKQILETFSRLGAPGSMLSFFEYVAVRKVKAAISGVGERQRLRGIAQLLSEFLGPKEIHCDCVLMNVTPAWVHHVRLHPVAGAR